MTSQSGLAQTLEVLHLTGDASQSGTTVGLGRPSGVAPGTVIFPASIDIGAFDDPDAILRHRAGVTTEVAIEQQVVAGSYQLFSFYGGSQTLPSANAQGDVLFNAEFIPLGGVQSDEGIFLYDDSSGAIVPVVMDGQTVVDGNGVFDVNLNNHPAVADGGQVAFYAGVFGAVGGLGNGSGLYRWDNGNLVRIVRSGQAVPGGGSTFDDFTWPSLNRQGEVAFVGFHDSGTEAAYRGNGAALVEIARTGDEAPAGWEIRDLSPLSGVAVNDAGQVAFLATVDPPGCCGTAHVIYLGQGGALTRLAFGGQAVSNGGTLPLTVNRHLTLNDRGQVAFMASGIFRAGPEGLLAIAREGATVPGSASQTFIIVSGRDMAINEQGDVAFMARFDNGTSFVEGLFLYTDASGLQRVAEPGTPLAGSVVQSLVFVGTNPNDWRSSEPSGLDDSGNVTFRFILTDNRRGIAVFRKPVAFADGFESGDLARWAS